MTVDELQKEIGEWGDTTFPKSTIGTIGSHLAEELEEFWREHINGTDNRAEELADMFLLMLHYAHRANFSLHDAAMQKMAVNRERSWKLEPELEGHFKHDR